MTVNEKKNFTPENKAKVLIIGSGGIGMVASHTLEHKGLSEVTIVVRSAYEQASEEGYHIQSATFGEHKNWKPTRIVKDVPQALTDDNGNEVKYDYVFVSLKNTPDGPMTCEDIIEPAIKSNPDTCIILVQNGIDIEKPMIERFPGTTILSGVSLIGTTTIGTHVNQKSPDNLTLGAFKNDTLKDGEHLSSSKIEDFVDLYSVEGKNTVNIDHDVGLTRWKKLVYNAAVNTVTALVNLDCSRAVMANVKEPLYRPIMNEIYEIAKSEGYILPPELKEVMMSITDGLFYTPSMLVDVRLGRLIEVEVIVGNPVKIAEKNGVNAPHLTMMYHLLKMIQFRQKEKLGLVKVDETVCVRKDTEEYGKGF
ncbi:oxidoreductase activity protein [[Candida] boidinii]|nr:oxidoreductase activity protein [[Candida] boidinii]